MNAFDRIKKLDSWRGDKPVSPARVSGEIKNAYLVVLWVDTEV